MPAPPSQTSRLTRDRAIAIAVFAASIALDQLSKLWAIHALRGQPPRVFAGNLFRLEYAENAGSFLSLGDRLPSALRIAIFVVGVGLGMVALIAYTVRKRELPTGSRIALLAIAAGGLSNWVDRAIRGARVVDFMNLGIGPVRTGIFNVADLAIVFGAIWLAVRGLSHPHASDDPASREPQPR